jgi:hypothetical protein
VLDGLSFAVLLHTPGPMIVGNWKVGLVLDERGSHEQREALTTFAPFAWSSSYARSRRGRDRVT